jgi:hypothetical protein
MTAAVPDELAPAVVGGKVTDVSHVRGALDLSATQSAIAASPVATTEASGLASRSHVRRLSGQARALEEFGDPIAMPYGTITSGTSTGNNATTWAANNAALTAAAAAGGAVYLPEGDIAVSDGFVWALSGTHWISQSRKTRIIYGPGWVSTPLAKPMIAIGNEGWMTSCSLIGVTVSGLYQSHGCVVVERCVEVTLDDCLIGDAHPDYWALDLSAVYHLHSRRLATTGPFGIILRGAAEADMCQQLWFANLNLGNWYKGLEIRGGFNNVFEELSSDMNTDLITAFGEHQGIASNDDAVSIDVVAHQSGLVLRDLHLENSTANQGHGIGLRCLATGTGTIDGLLTVGWATELVGGAAYVRNRNGLLSCAVNLSLCRADSCHFLGSPDGTMVAADFGLAATTAATTLCTGYWALPIVALTGTSMLDKSMIWTGRTDPTTYTSALAVCRYDNQTGDVTVISETGLGAHVETVRAKDGAGLLQLWSPAWNGWVGDPDYPTGPYYDPLRYSYIARVTVTPGSAGAVTVRPPRFYYSTHRTATD